MKWLLAASVLGVAWGGCSATKTTELVPGVLSQIQIPKNLRAIRIDVQPTGEPSRCVIHSVDPNNPGFITLPRTLGLLAGGDAKRLVTVTVTGYSKDEDQAQITSDCLLPPAKDGKYDANVRLLRRSRLSYTDSKILFLPMVLRYSCWDAAACPDDQTCKAGTCVPSDVDPKSLPEFTNELIDGNSNTCFSAKTCFADNQPAKVIDADKCIYDLNLPPIGTGANVRVFYDAEGGESEILDLDKDEGFTIPDPASPHRFQLAPGLCSMVKGDAKFKHKIIAVSTASVCPSKTVFQPICAGEQHPPPALPDGGTSADGGCNVSHEMTPAPSALYVMMDQSKSMDSVFGPSGLTRILNFSLNDPAFRSTNIAFKLLSHQPADCAGPLNTFNTVDVPFTPAVSAQLMIASIVGDKSKVLPDDRTMYLDAALQANGAYNALRSFKQSSGLAFNRLAVLIVANRTIPSSPPDCGAGHPLPSAEAAIARATADRIFTYVVMLDNPSATPDTTEGRAIATGGGTSFFDATVDKTIGPRAFNQIVSDLGTCLYEKAPGIDNTATISYTNPLTFQAVNIPFNGGCTSSSSSDGWNFDGDRVRLCGKSCTDLRDVLTNTSNLFEAQNLPPPNIPVTATQVCK